MANRNIIETLQSSKTALLRAMEALQDAFYHTQDCEGRRLAQWRLNRCEAGYHACERAIALLREQGRSSVAPLERADLFRMDGKPVWVVDLAWGHAPQWGIVSVWKEQKSNRCAVYIYNVRQGARMYPMQDYGTCWVAFTEEVNEVA